MSGTREGAKKAREKNLQNNPDYYREIRKKRKAGGGGFKNNSKLASEAGRKGALARWAKKDTGEQPENLDNE